MEYYYINTYNHEPCKEYKTFIFDAHAVKKLIKLKTL